MLPEEFTKFDEVLLEGELNAGLNGPAFLLKWSNFVCPAFVQKV